MTDREFWQDVFLMALEKDYTADDAFEIANDALTLQPAEDTNRDE